MTSRQEPSKADLDATSRARRFLEFFAVAERLKCELRHSWMSDGRRESVAEHTWSVALLALLASPYLEQPVKLEKVLAMAIVHDLAEAKAGDVPYFETGPRKLHKEQREREAIEELAGLLMPPVSDTVRGLWNEFEQGQTPEAKFVRALDHCEVQAQHNLASLSSWEPIEHELVYTKMDQRCAHDAFLRELCLAIREQAEVKMRAAGVNVDAVKARLNSLMP